MSIKVVMSVASVSGTLHYRHTCELFDGDRLLMSANEHTHVEEGDEAASAARSALDRLRYLADDAERQLVKMGVLKKRTKKES